MRTHLFVFALISLLAACQKENFEETTSELATYTFSQTELDNISRNFCRTIDPVGYDMHAYLQEEGHEGGTEDRATSLKGKCWPAGKNLRVRFLNNNATLTNKVMAAAKEWEKYADVTFTRVSSGTSEIRIRYDAKDGHWSYVGTDNGNIPQDQKTMNLALSASSWDEEINRVVLHEFGHALGLTHEHQNPLADIPWNKSKAYAYYAQTQGWSKTEVDQWVLNKETFLAAQHTAFDPKSIMEYPVPEELTTNGYSIGWNTTLSQTDKEFIKSMYGPKKIRVRHAANISGNIRFYVNGIYHSIAKNETLAVPANNTNNDFSVWEYASGSNGWGWTYLFISKGNYKLVSDPNNPNDFKLMPDE